MYQLDVKRYAEGQTIVKSGDVCEYLMMVRSGEVNATVSYMKDETEDETMEELIFDTLNTGSCMNVY